MLRNIQIMEHVCVCPRFYSYELHENIASLRKQNTYLSLFLQNKPFYFCKKFMVQYFACMYMLKVLLEMNFSGRFLNK